LKEHFVIDFIGCLLVITLITKIQKMAFRSPSEIDKPAKGFPHSSFSSILLYAIVGLEHFNACFKELFACIKRRNVLVELFVAQNKRI
jgi:hypothetical protein